MEQLLEEEWLVLHWPEDEPRSTKAWRSNLPIDTPLVELIGYARLRWRIERDYQEGKGLLGLDHYERRQLGEIGDEPALGIRFTDFDPLPLRVVKHDRFAQLRLVARDVAAQHGPGYFDHFDVVLGDAVRPNRVDDGHREQGDADSE